MQKRTLAREVGGHGYIVILRKRIGLLPAILGALEEPVPQVQFALCVRGNDDHLVLAVVNLELQRRMHKASLGVRVNLLGR